MHTNFLIPYNSPLNALFKTDFFNFSKSSIFDQNRAIF